MKSAKELHKTLLEIATLARFGDENARSHILHLATKATGIKQDQEPPEVYVVYQGSAFWKANEALVCTPMPIEGAPDWANYGPVEVLDDGDVIKARIMAGFQLDPPRALTEEEHG
jgi:hypothetical protein